MFIFAGTYPLIYTEEKVQKVIDVLEDWFQAIENGSAFDRLPDPTGKRYDENFVKKTIRRIDACFRYEMIHYKNYHRGVGLRTKGKPIEYPPDFKRLTGASREAFVQDIIRIKHEVFGDNVRDA